MLQEHSVSLLHVHVVEGLLHSQVVVLVLLCLHVVREFHQIQHDECFVLFVVCSHECLEVPFLLLGVVLNHSLNQFDLFVLRPQAFLRVL